MTDKIKLLLAYAVVGVLAVLGSLYAPSSEMKASCVGIAVAVSALLRSVLQPPPPPGPPSPPSTLATLAFGLVPMVAFALVGVVLTIAVALFAGCGFLEHHPNLPKSLSDEIECAIEHVSDDPKVLIAECGPGIIPIVADIVTAKHDRQAVKARLVVKANAVTDAGTDGGR